MYEQAAAALQRLPALPCMPPSLMKVVYDDGEEEMFHLGSEKVVWRVYAPQQQQQNQSQPASQPSSPNKGQAGNSSSGVFKAGNMAGASRASCSGGGRGAAGSRGAGSGSGGGRASYRGGLLDDPMVSF